MRHTDTSGARRRARGGFTLIELLIVVAIIGIIAAILIPNLIDAIHKAKQKRSVSDIRNIGIAWMAWATDQIAAGAAGAAVSGLDWGEDLPNSLSPEDMAGLLQGDADGNAIYLSNMPSTDGWGNRLDFGSVIDADDPTTFNLLITSSRTVGIRSRGRDGIEDDSGAYAAGRFPSRLYNSDIVWVDGYFVRSPGGTAVSTGSGG